MMGKRYENTEKMFEPFRNARMQEWSGININLRNLKDIL